MVRKFEDKDWNMIQDWWGDSPLKPIRELLPNDSTYIISNKKEDVACACLYFTNCDYVCLIENVVSNPKIEKTIRQESVAKLFKFLEQIARDKGYKSVSLFSANKKLKVRCVELGFLPITSDITTFSKLI